MAILIGCGIAGECRGADEVNRIGADGSGAREARRQQFEVTTTLTPRFDSLDGSTRSSRIDMLMLPLSRSGLGFSVGVASAGGTSYGSVTPSTTTAPSFNLGVHWRYTLDDSHRLDVTAYRRVSSVEAIDLIQSRDPGYGARVEMRMAPMSSRGFVAEKGFVGFQLESGAKITVKRSRGVPMVYYRNTF